MLRQPETLRPAASVGMTNRYRERVVSTVAPVVLATLSGGKVSPNGL